MSDSAGSSVGWPPEFTSALKKLQRLFAGVLWDAKLNSCGEAWIQIKRLKAGKQKREVITEKAQQWREDTAKAIRVWLPKFVDLANAYPEATGADPLGWTKDRVWEEVEGLCGIRRRKEGEPLRPDHINRTTIYWLAVASEGNFEVDVPPLKRWNAPRWLAGNGKTTDDLLRDHTARLSIRLNHVIEEEIDLAEIQRVSHRMAAELGPLMESAVNSPTSDGELAKEAQAKLGIERPSPFDDAQLSKGVREGRTVVALYSQLKKIRSLYRDKGWTISQIRQNTDYHLAIVWEWIDRIDPSRKSAFLKVNEWDDGDKFIYLQIATLYS